MPKLIQGDLFSVNGFIPFKNLSPNTTYKISHIHRLYGKYIYNIATPKKIQLFQIPAQLLDPFVGHQLIMKT